MPPRPTKCFQTPRNQGKKTLDSKYFRVYFCYISLNCLGSGAQPALRRTPGLSIILASGEEEEEAGVNVLFC